jgi:Tol biopolymer transport system component
MSRDGRYVLFASDSTDLVANDTNDVDDVFIKDRQTGQVIRASVSTSGAEANGVSWPGSITPDGRWVVFQSYATNLVASDTNGKADLFVFDRLTRRTVLISRTMGGGAANGDSFGSSISADGRFVTFESDARDLVPNDFNNARDIFLVDRQTNTTTRVSCRRERSGSLHRELYNLEFIHGAPNLETLRPRSAERRLVARLEAGRASAAEISRAHDHRGPLAGGCHRDRGGRHRGRRRAAVQTAAVR